METSSCKTPNRIELKITSNVTNGNVSFLAVISPTNNGKIDHLAAIVRLAELNTMKDIDRDFIP